MENVKLNDGTLIPRIGLGVFRTRSGEETEQAVRWALDAGYRHIDTAKAYRNEESVGRAIRESGIDRKEIFITTKLIGSKRHNIIFLTFVCESESFKK